MTPPDPALLGALVVAAIAGAADLYFLGGAAPARQYEADKKEFYDENWKKCKDLDDLATQEFARSLATSELWKAMQSGRGSATGTSADGGATVHALEEIIRLKAPALRADLEKLLAQARERTGNKERIERLRVLYDKCASYTRQGWAALAVLLIVASITFAGYISGSSDFSQTVYVLLILAGVVSALVVYGNALNWQNANKDLVRCKSEIENAIHNKINFAEPPVAGLQEPPASPPPPAAKPSGLVATLMPEGSSVVSRTESYKRY